MVRSFSPAVEVDGWCKDNVWIDLIFSLIFLSTSKHACDGGVNSMFWIKHYNTLRMSSWYKTKKKRNRVCMGMIFFFHWIVQQVTYYIHAPCHNFLFCSLGFPCQVDVRKTQKIKSSPFVNPNAYNFLYIEITKNTSKVYERNIS